jgi:hypothetical protein
MITASRYIHDDARTFAARMTSLGFTVYLAERGSYGFLTDDTESRVLSFSFNDGGSLSGNYGPASHESGTGWRLDGSPQSLRTKDDVIKALYAHPPGYCGKGWKSFTTVAQHLAIYGASSRYARVEV